MIFKNLILTTLAFASFSASAVEVVSAKLDSSAENLVVTVRHGGGCGQHSYKLIVTGCFETMPVKCQATIQHTTADFCEAYLTREAKFNLKEYGLNASYYKDASITISGDRETSATASLKITSTNSSENVRCLTHTGSVLEITNESVVLTTASNENAQYAVVNKRVIVLESLPSIFQSIYKLDDGRSIITNFKSNSKSGTGNFIRNDGSRSPDFSCVKN